MSERRQPPRVEKGLASIVLLAIGFLCAVHVHATCVASNDTQGLLNALASATNAGSPVTIKLEQGNYVTQGDIAPGEFEAEVKIQGGYMPTAGHSCDESQRVLDSSKTKVSLDGDLILTNVPNALIRLDDLSIEGAATSQLIVFADSIEVFSVRVTDFYTMIGDIVGSGGTIKLTNVQFDKTASGVGCFVTAELTGHRNMVIDHATVDLSSGDFCIDSGLEDGNKHVSMWNSIFWDWASVGGSISTSHSYSDDPITLEVNDVDYTDIENLPADVVVTNAQYPNAQFDPLWTDPAAGDYSISAGPASVAVNTGTVDVPEGEPPTDILGATRKVGSHPDMGAHESPYDDNTGGNVFYVTNTNDVFDVNNPLYAGSLRAAMDKAFALNGPSLVQFFMPACPSVITLNAPLPTVWSPLTLNGYASGGSSVNTDLSGFFNARLCVAIQPADTATTPTALMVPSGAHDAALTVDGIGFGGFSQAIQLWGGYGHQIVGNQFGGLMNGVQLFGSDIAAIRIETSGSVIVGGSNVADHNVFLNANGWNAGDSAAVLVGLFANNTSPVCQIVGNLFGITPDGFSASPNNEYGILLQGSGCLVQGNRMAGNTRDAIYILGGSNHIIQNNVIGPAMFFGQDFSNPGAGIRIAAGGSNNIIGAPPGFGGNYYANVIKDMDLGGVLIGGDGAGNSVRGNQITKNGLASGLNLDLGLDGPSANDPGDVDTGANEVMNYPRAHAFRWSNGVPAPGTSNIAAAISGLMDLAPGHYQLDAYYDDACGASGRGGGGWLGGSEVDIASSGTAGFEMPVTIPAYDPAHGEISLTATRIMPGQNSTSEFSECLSVDSIFYDGLEH